MNTQTLAAGGGRFERGVRCAVPKRAEVDRLMKRCQIGVGGRHALDNAHDIMAECYGTLGALMLTVERYAAALEWIEGATAATPGLTDAELGRAMATIGRRAGGELRAPNVGGEARLPALDLATTQPRCR